MQTYDLLKLALARSDGSSFLLITQYEMPFVNKSEARKKKKKKKRQMHKWSHVWPVYFIYNIAIFLSIIMQLQMQTDIFLVLFVRHICILRGKCVSCYVCTCEMSFTFPCSLTQRIFI